MCTITSGENKIFELSVQSVQRGKYANKAQKPVQISEETKKKHQVLYGHPIIEGVLPCSRRGQWNVTVHVNFDSTC